MKIKSAESTTPEVDMTPMIDIVFQLIAFFMVITNFEQNQADERVTLPLDELAKPPEVKREDVLTLNIGYLRDEGQLLDPDPFVFFGDEKLRVAELRPRLREESEFFKLTKTEPADVFVEIRADAGVETGLIQELIQMCQEDKISFQRFAMKATQKID